MFLSVLLFLRMCVIWTLNLLGSLILDSPRLVFALIVVVPPSVLTLCLRAPKAGALSCQLQPQHTPIRVTIVTLL